MKGVGAGTRVFDLLDRQSAIPLSVGKTLEKGRNGPIIFENVSFTYPSRKEVEVLKGVDLQIDVGTSLAIAYVPCAPCLLAWTLSLMYRTVTAVRAEVESQVSSS
jgi:ABC-type transport system involved in Fe-S cluster assembly fused permease/ATPase subunit